MKTVKTNISFGLNGAEKHLNIQNSYLQIELHLTDFFAGTFWNEAKVRLVNYGMMAS